LRVVFVKTTACLLVYHKHSRLKTPYLYISAFLLNTKIMEN
jgi:hypothetical protein